MNLTAAVLGAGRMGSFVGLQLPREVKKVIVDTDEPKAKKLAEEVGGRYFLGLEGVGEADIIAIVLPAPAIPEISRGLLKHAKKGAVIINMATNGKVEEEVKAARPDLHFVDAKIIGHAGAMSAGAPSYVVVNTGDQEVYEKISYILPGYTKVVMGDSDLVPEINTIGSTEGIRAAVEVRKQLKKYNIPKDWEDIVIYTVCAGTMRAYVDDDLGGFGRALADRLEAEI
ncbi:MAG: NAD(P)-binding domain-containing protein [Peptococcaceae bacterium]|nr:NAD(P)-binding domain-containing protein [Peptococcaceae bacterium]